MRRNKVSLNITRFNSDVPKGYPNDKMSVNIYADSNNLYAALSKAYAKAINVMEEWERVAVSCEITTNADGTVFAETLNRRYNENYELEYYDRKIEANKKLLGYIENSTAILAVIKSSRKEDVRGNLSEKFGYTLEETNNILRINFGMMTAEDIDAIKNETAELEARLAKKPQDTES